MSDKEKESESETTRILRIAIKKIAGSLTETDELLPEYAIVGSGLIFCYSPSKKRFIKINRGQKVLVIDGDTTFNNKVLIFTFDGNLVEIETSELLCTNSD